MVGNVQVRTGDTIRLKVTHSELNIMFEVLGVDANPEQQQQQRQQQQGEKSKDAMATEGADKIPGAS